MKRELYFEEGAGTRRIAVVEDGQPVELLMERESGIPVAGSIYMGRVLNVALGISSAFVDIGDEKNSFLPLVEAPGALRGIHAPESMQKPHKLRPGDEILVQIQREAHGEKGAKVSMHITFPGKYAVLLATVSGAFISRHIEEEAKRQALLSLAEQALLSLPGMGVVIRTAANDAPHDEIREEIASLAEEWKVLSKRANAQKAPALIMGAGSLVDRAARDFHGVDIQTGIPPEIQSKIEKALRHRIWLDCGGTIVIDRCEAMTVIDVNSGKFTGKKSINETALKVNLEAAEEIARQIRLRDMAGIIVIDFVDMQSDQDRETVEQAFLLAMEGDRAKRHFHGFTKAGLYEMTRRAVLMPLASTYFQPCPRCKGEGIIQAIKQGAKE